MQETTVKCPVSGKRIGSFKINERGWEQDRHDGTTADVEIAPSLSGATVIVVATRRDRTPADWKAAETEAGKQIRAELTAGGVTFTDADVTERVAQVMAAARAGDEGVADALKIPPEHWIEMRTLHDVSPEVMVSIRNALRDNCGMSGALEVPL